MKFKKIGRALKKAGKSAIKGIRTAELAVRRNKTAKAIVNKALPLVADLAIEGIATYAGADPRTAKTLGQIGKIGTSEGLKAGGYAPPKKKNAAPVAVATPVATPVSNDTPIPAMRTGGVTKGSRRYKLHKGELVVDAATTKKLRSLLRHRV